MKRQMITYPTRQLLAVIDRPADAAEAATDLDAAGWTLQDVRVLVGEAGRDQLGRLGSEPNVLSRVVRLFQFLSMDQTPDFLVYERAIADGRAVIAVHAADRQEMVAAKVVVEGHGGHFLNYFGRVSTEEVSMWRGEEPDIPDALRR